MCLTGPPTGADGTLEVLEWEALGAIGHVPPRSNFTRSLKAFDLPSGKKRPADGGQAPVVLCMPFRSSVLMLFGLQKGLPSICFPSSPVVPTWSRQP